MLLYHPKSVTCTLATNTGFRFWHEIQKAVPQPPPATHELSSDWQAFMTAAAAAAAAVDAEDHNFLCGSFLPLLERVHADFFSAIDGLVECLRTDADDDADADAYDAADVGPPFSSQKRVAGLSGTHADSDHVASVSSCDSSSSKTDVYRGFDLSVLTSPLHKDILPHTVNILR